MRKRVVSMLLVAAMTVSFAMGCSGGSDSGTSEDNADSSTSEDSADSSSKEEQKDVQSEENQEAGTVKSGTVAYDIDMSQYDKGKVVRVWLPIAQTNDYQTVEEPEFDAGDAKTELTEDSQGNKMLYVEWGADADAANRKASCSFKVSRQEIKSPELVEKGEIGSDMEEYLKESSTIPLDGEVKATADEITKGKETVLDKARAIYDWVIANMNRDESVTGCGTGDVCALLVSKGGKCTDINSVFVGLCRAAGIPAREMFGIRINDTTITGNQHCWAEFYLPGTGWVLADPADVLKAVLKNEWEKDSAEAKEKQEFYWGNCENERLELSRGRDIDLNPKQDGKALNNFGYPYAEVDGEVIDYYTPDKFVYTISFAEGQ